MWQLDAIKHQKKEISELKEALESKRGIIKKIEKENKVLLAEKEQQEQDKKKINEELECENSELRKRLESKSGIIEKLQEENKFLLEKNQHQN